MTQKCLNHTNIDILFEQMRGEAVPQRMWRDALLDPRGLRGGQRPAFKGADKRRYRGRHSRDGVDANCSGLSERLQPGRDIDRIPKQVVALHQDVADVDAYSKLHLLTRRWIRILLGQGVLHRDSTSHGVRRAGEIGDETVARRVEDPTPMRGDQAIDYDPVSRERAKGTDLISVHQTAVALDIGGEDRRKLAFDGARFQASPPPARAA